jgi:hypothetical protein
MALATCSSAIYRKGMAIGHRLFAMTPSYNRLILLSMFFMNRHYLHSNLECQPSFAFQGI